MKDQTLNELLRVIAKLRSDSGCPWDRAQTHETLIPFLKEESAEVIDAIILQDSENLKEELGDLLLQVLLHAQIASEASQFSFEDVMQTLTAKLIRRHPHVFAGKTYANEAEQKADWDHIKQQEKLTKSSASKMTSILAPIPFSLEPMEQARLIQAKAATVGFDWDNFHDVMAKVEEEKAEFEEALALKDSDAIESELGDLFFSLINAARFLNIDPSVALNRTNAKFRARFSDIESDADKPLTEMSLEELDARWDRAKAKGL